MFSPHCDSVQSSNVTAHILVLSQHQVATPVWKSVDAESVTKNSRGVPQGRATARGEIPLH